MINIFQNIKDLCKKKLIIPFIFIIIMIFILIKCPFTDIFSPQKTNNIYHIQNNFSYVNVTADKLYYTGYNLTPKIGKQYGYYYALKDNQCIFVLLPMEKGLENELKDYNFYAKVVSPDKTYKKMLSAFSKDINWSEKGISNVTADFVLSCADYHPYFYVTLLIIILIILIKALINFIKAMTGVLKPESYSACAFLNRGSQKDIITEAQDELATGNYIQINSMYITENYFIDLGHSKISIIPLNEVVWCYRLGVIPWNPKQSTPQYSINFTLINGQIITVNQKSSDEALELINAIRATEYKIIIGHSASKEKDVKAIINEYKQI